jgi:hypothetical protein
MEITPMKKLILTIALLIAAPIFAQTYVNGDKDGTFISGEVISNPVASTALTVPGTAEWAMISIRTAGVHVKFDATAATTSDLYMPTGLYRTSYVAGTPTALLTKIRLINSTDGAAVVYVSYWKRP